MVSIDGRSVASPDPAIEGLQSPSVVTIEDDAAKQRVPAPDPRWPYLGRWSTPRTATPPAIRTGTSVPTVIAIDPPLVDVTDAAPHGSPPLVIAIETDAAPHGSGSHPLAIKDVETSMSPLNPGALSHDPNVAAEENSSQANLRDDVTNGEMDSVTEAEKDDGFVHSLGAWSKPLHFTPPSTPSESSTPMIGVSEEIKNQIGSFWPSLGESAANGQKKNKGKIFPDQATPLLPVKNYPPPALKDDGSIRFPWAARMNQSSRNLFRAAEPTYRLDGTPQVTIPSSVLKIGPENHEEYIIGQFHRCSSPPGGLIHAVLNRLWGRECKISCKKLGDASYLFHIPHENTRKWVVHRGVWHVDDYLLFVSPWSPVSSLKTPEISTLPVWVTLKNIPNSCFSRLGISHIASGLGEPMLTHRPRLDPTNMGEAKILVEVELDKPFPKLIALDDKQGNIFLVVAEYAWIPSACARCGALGHKEKRCLLPPKPVDTDMVVQAAENTQAINEEIPVVDIVKVMQNCAAPSTNSLQQTPFTPATNLEQNQTSSSQQEPETPKKSSPISQSNPIIGSSVNLHEVHSIHRSMSDNTLLSLAATVDAATTPQIMEETPSLAHIKEVSNSLEKEQNFGESFKNSTHSQNIYQSNQESLLGCGEEKGQLLVGESSGYNLTRGGRTIKPTQKIQEMEWTTIRGKGKRGRRGRGTYYR